MQRIFSYLAVASISVALTGCKPAAEKSDEKAAEPASATDAAKSGADAAAKEAPAAAKQVAAKMLEEQTVEAGCAKCIYKMDGVKECTLAIKVAGKPYVATGVDVDPHKEGLCEATKKATIAGTVEGAKVALTKFEFEK